MHWGILAPFQSQCCARYGQRTSAMCAHNARSSEAEVRVVHCVPPCDVEACISANSDASQRARGRVVMRGAQVLVSLVVRRDGADASRARRPIMR